MLFWTPQRNDLSCKKLLHNLSVEKRYFAWSITPVTVNLCAQYIPTKLVLFVSCIYHRMSVYILCTPTKCRICTTPVVPIPLLPHNTPPIPPSYLHPADLKQMGMCHGRRHNITWGGHVPLTLKKKSFGPPHICHQNISA